MAHTVQNVFTVTAGWTQTVSPRGYGHHCNRFHMHCEASEAKEALITTRQLSDQEKLSTENVGKLSVCVLDKWLTATTWVSGICKHSNIQMFKPAKLEHCVTMAR